MAISLFLVGIFRFNWQLALASPPSIAEMRCTRHTITIELKEEGFCSKAFPPRPKPTSGVVERGWGTVGKGFGAANHALPEYSLAFASWIPGGLPVRRPVESKGNGM